MRSKPSQMLLVAVLSAWVAAAAKAEDKKDSPAPPAGAALSFPGRIEAAEQVGIQPRVAAAAAKVNVDIGDRVKKGQVLIELSAPELRDALDEAQARLAQAKAMAEEAEAQAKAVEAARNAAAAAELLRAEAAVKAAQAGVAVAEAGVRRAQTRLEYTTIVAPFDGIVTRRLVDAGATVGPPTPGETAPLLTVMRDDTVVVAIDVDERSAPRVPVGAPVVVNVQSLADAVKGKVTRTAGVFNPDSGTMRVKIDLPNPDGKLRPGMFVTVQVKPGEAGK